MKMWLAGVITASLFLSVLSSLLPENGVKRAALTAFGFVFLGVVVSPVINAINGGFSPDVLMMESITETKNIGGDDYIANVAKEYKSRLEQECENALSELEGYTPEVTVGINEETNEGNFGDILWVKCLLIRGHETEKSEEKNYIDKIIIDFNGIKTDEKEDSKDESMKVYAEEKLSDFLGIKKEAVYVEFG